jgi:hypothetical protein
MNNSEYMLQCISKLPRTLQDHINMYNIQHRPLMKLVCDEFMFTAGVYRLEHQKRMKLIIGELLYYYKEFECYNCNNYSRRIDPESVIILSYCQRQYCCMDCCYDDRWL